jgi:hypothetical protein
MARVPQHFRDKLISSRTGVNTLDTSAADSARAIGQMASTFQKGVVEFEVAKRQELMKSQGAKKKAEFLNQYAEVSKEIKSQYAGNPEEGFKVLEQKTQEIKDNILSGVENSRFQADLAPVLEGYAAEHSVRNKMWQLNQMDLAAKQLKVDTLSDNISAITKGATAQEYNDIVGDPSFTEQSYIESFGPEEGAKAFQGAKNALFRARADSLLDQGRIFEAQDFIEKSQEPDGKIRAEVKENFVKAQKGYKAKQFFQTVSAASIDAVEVGEQIAADDMTIGAIDDRVLEISMKAELAETPEEKEVYQKYVGILAGLRDLKLEQTLLSAKGDLDAETNLQAQYQELFIKSEGGGVDLSSEFSLNDFLGFQRQLVEQAQAGKVSAKNFNKWMFWSKVALTGQVENLEEEGGWFSKGQRLESDPKIRGRVKDFLRESRALGSSWKTSVLEYVYDNIPSKEPDQINADVLGALFQKGKLFATLKDRGYPVEIMDTKVVTTPAGSFNIIGQDQDGMPIVNVDSSRFEN